MTQLDVAQLIANRYPVCGGWKASFEEHCKECTEWKENAEKRRAAEARRKAFGNLL